MRMLCLHGMGHSAVGLRTLLRRISKPPVQAVYVDAPYKHHCGRMWTPVPQYVQSKPRMNVHLLSKAFTTIDGCIETHGIDHLYGFSQGAAVVDAYMSVGKYRESIKSVILDCGYEYTFDSSRPLISAPTLLINSYNDSMVPPELRPKHYSSITCVTHRFGHRVHMPQSMASIVSAFLHRPLTLSEI